MKYVFLGLTILFALMTALTGFGNVTHAAPIMESLQKLGYPAYFATIIGVFKLAGAVALFVPRIRVFAYVGFAFLFLGAVASHILANDALPSIGAGVYLVVLALLFAAHQRLFALTETPRSTAVTAR